MNHSSRIEYENYKKHTKEPNSFIVIDTTLSSCWFLKFRKLKRASITSTYETE